MKNRLVELVEPLKHQISFSQYRFEWSCCALWLISKLSSFYPIRSNSLKPQSTFGVHAEVHRKVYSDSDIVHGTRHIRVLFFLTDGIKRERCRDPESEPITALAHSMIPRHGKDATERSAFPNMLSIWWHVFARTSVVDRAWTQKDLLQSHPVTREKKW